MAALMAADAASIAGLPGNPILCRPEAVPEPAVPKTDLAKCQEVMDAAIEADALALKTAKGIE